MTSASTEVANEESVSRRPPATVHAVITDLPDILPVTRGEAAMMLAVLGTDFRSLLDERTLPTNHRR